MLKRILLVALAIARVLVVGLWWNFHRQHATLDIIQVEGTQPVITTPHRGLIPTINVAKAVGWKAGEAPTPAAGLKVQPFATGLDHPRWLLALPNGDVLVAESNAPPHPDDGKGLTAKVQKSVMKKAGAGVASPNRIILLRDADGDGIAEARTTLLQGLNSPFGMTLANRRLYIANTDAIVSVPFVPGQTRIAGPPVKLIDLPAGTINHHWTKNVIAKPDGSRLYVTIGSNSNVGENGSAAEKDRAQIWEVDPKTGQHRVYAYGIRNPNGMAWQPGADQLWTVVNERDALGSDLVPDYLTAVQFGGFYGWPWFYWGGYPDGRPKDPPPDLIQDSAIKPDYALGPHTASLGLTFATGETLGLAYADGAFIGQHGSWNRDPPSGYKVVFVNFRKGQPVGKPIDVLTGFLDAKGRARGRPVGVAIAKDGALLVADDVGNRIWRVARR